MRTLSRESKRPVIFFEGSLFMVVSINSIDFTFFLTENTLATFYTGLLVESYIKRPHTSKKPGRI